MYDWNYREICSPYEFIMLYLFVVYRFLLRGSLNFLTQLIILYLIIHINIRGNSTISPLLRQSSLPPKDLTVIIIITIRNLP